MSNDGADRRKQRIDALSDYIRDGGTSGRRISECIVWAKRQHGLTAPTARSYIDTLQESREVLLAQKDQRLRHIDTYPPTQKTAAP